MCPTGHTAGTGGPKIASRQGSRSRKNHRQQEDSLCEKFFGAALYNGFLEQTCGFEGQVKDRLSSMMDSAHCLPALPKLRRDKLAAQVLDDAEMRLKAYGEAQFCEANLQDYTHLMDMLPEATDNNTDNSASPDNNSQL